MSSPCLPKSIPNHNLQDSGELVFLRNLGWGGTSGTNYNHCHCSGCQAATDTLSSTIHSLFLHSRLSSLPDSIAYPSGVTEPHVWRTWTPCCLALLRPVLLFLYIHTHNRVGEYKEVPYWLSWAPHTFLSSSHITTPLPQSSSGLKCIMLFQLFQWEKWCTSWPWSIKERTFYGPEE